MFFWMKYLLVKYFCWNDDFSVVNIEFGFEGNMLDYCRLLYCRL